MEQGIRREVTKMIQAMLTRSQANVGEVLGALTNRAYDAGIATVATLTAPTSGIFATAVVKAKASGLFVVMASGTAVSGLVETAGSAIGLVSQTPATAGVGITVTGGGSPSNGVSLSSGTTAITLAAATGSMASAVNQVTQYGLNGLASSSLQTPFGISGIFGATAAPVVAVPVGSTIAFSLAGTIATTTLTLIDLALSVYELP